MAAVEAVVLEQESMPVYLTKGMTAYVSPQDHARVTELRWQAHKGKRTWYARHVQRLPGGKFKSTYLHRFVTGDTDPEIKVDHRDGNGLNNTRLNLRATTGRQNSYNTRKPTSGMTSQYKGVFWDEASKRWRAQINVNGKKSCLGRYKEELPAGRAYDRAALEAFGEFAQINFPNGVPDPTIPF